MGLGVVWELLGASWDPKCISGEHPPPGVPRWSQTPAKIDLEAIQKEVNFLIGSGVGFYMHFVPTWFQLGSQTPPKIDPSWTKIDQKCGQDGDHCFA